MAAHMHRALWITYDKIGKSRVSVKKCASLQPLLLNNLHLRRDNSSSVDLPPLKSDSSQQQTPNQTTLEDSSAGDNLRKLPSLLKSSEDETSDLSFATLFRQSNFAHLGSPRGRVVVGTIYRVVGDDLYVDFDWKFPCVVKRPTQDAHLYVNSAVVRLRIIDLEMSTIFLGAAKETSLNEANCFLIGLINSPLGVPKSQQAPDSY